MGGQAWRTALGVLATPVAKFYVQLGFEPALRLVLYAVLTAMGFAAYTLTFSRRASRPRGRKCEAGSSMETGVTSDSVRSADTVAVTPHCLQHFSVTHGRFYASLGQSGK